MAYSGLKMQQKHCRIESIDMSLLQIGGDFLKKGENMNNSKENALLRMKKISKSFVGVQALSSVDFNLEYGQIHALLGENGAGKSTLIKVLTGVEKNEAGSIFLEGKRISPSSPLDAQKLGISAVYQEVNLCANLTVAENIYIGREPKHYGIIDWRKMALESKALLNQFGLNIDVNKPLNSYSVAIQQMVAICRAVDIKAKILILDEPTSSLDNEETKKLFKLMRTLKSQGIGIIFITHFIDQIYEISDYITVLRNGQLVGSWNIESLSRLQLISKMIGKEYDELDENIYLNIEDNDHEILMEVNELSSSAVHPFSLKVRKGEVLGFAGLLGSGRSEIMRLLFGVDKKENGTIKINNVKIDFSNQLDAIKNGIAYCPENRKTEGIVGDLSIKENLILALQAKRGMMHLISQKEADELCKNYIDLLNIKTPSPDQSIRNLSGGNQQKVLIARWLATSPILLMLDEPTRGIDIGAKAEIQRIIVDLATNGMSVMFVSSEIDEMLRCCNYMIVLRDRKKIGQLSQSEINKNKIMKMIAGESCNEKVQ